MYHVDDVETEAVNRHWTRRITAEQVDLGPLDAARVGAEDARMVVAAGHCNDTF